MMKSIAVLMTVYNRKQKTLRCLDNLHIQRLIEEYVVDVFLTDDGCTDGTIEAVLSKYPNIRIVSGDGTLFWNRGMYTAWSTAEKAKHYDYFFWLNDDTELEEDALITLLRASEEKSDKAIIVGVTSSISDKNIITYGGQNKEKRGYSIVYSRNRLVKCDTFNGNIVLVPSFVYKCIGMNDPYFHHSFGDIEYGLRASKYLIRSYVVPGILGVCDRNDPVPIFRKKGKSLFLRFKLLYSPLGHHPLEDFRLNSKYRSLLYAILVFIKLHINVFFTKK